MNKNELKLEELKLELLSLASQVVDLDWNANGDETLFDEIGAESFDILNLSVEIERKFKISLSDVSPYDIKTTGDLIDCVYKKLSQIPTHQENIKEQEIQV